jgi:cytochrome b subunit of formate dehydrogenase
MYMYPSLPVNSAVLHSCLISSGIKLMWILTYSSGSSFVFKYTFLMLMHMYRAPLLALEMVLLMWILIVSNPAACCISTCFSFVVESISYCS